MVITISDSGMLMVQQISPREKYQLHVKHSLLLTILLSPLK